MRRKANRFATACWKTQPWYVYIVVVFFFADIFMTLKCVFWMFLPLWKCTNCNLHYAKCGQVFANIIHTVACWCADWDQNSNHIAPENFSTILANPLLLRLALVFSLCCLLNYLFHFQSLVSRSRARQFQSPNNCVGWIVIHFWRDACDITLWYSFIANISLSYWHTTHIPNFMCLNNNRQRTWYFRIFFDWITNIHISLNFPQTRNNHRYNFFVFVLFGLLLVCFALTMQTAHLNHMNMEGKNEHKQ